MKYVFAIIFGFFISSLSFCQQFKLVLPTRHVAYIPLLCFTNDNKYLISISQDKTLKIWDSKNSRLIGEFITSEDVPYKYKEGLPFYVAPYVPSKRVLSDTIIKGIIPAKDQPIWITNSFTNGLIMLKVYSKKDSFKVYDETNNRYIIETSKAKISESSKSTKIRCYFNDLRRNFVIEVSTNNIVSYSYETFSNISAITISSDGLKAAIATNEGYITILDLQSLKQMSCVGHSNLIGDVIALPEDGEFLYCSKGNPYSPIYSIIEDYEKTTDRNINGIVS